MNSNVLSQGTMLMRQLCTSLPYWAAPHCWSVNLW